MSPIEISNVFTGYLTIFITVVGIYLSYRVGFSNTWKKQLNLVYSPLFIKLEPNLYKEIKVDTAKEYASLLYKTTNKYYALCDPVLIDLTKTFIKQVKSGSNYNGVFISICSHIDKNYEKLKRKLRLPKRKMLYRVRHDQYKSKGYLALFFAKYISIGLLQFFFAMIIAITLIGLIFMAINPLLESITVKTKNVLPIIPKK